LLELFWAIRSGWQDIILVGVAGLLLGIVYLFVATPVYTVKLVVGPVQNQNNSSSGGALRQLSALASLNLNSSNTGFNDALDIMQSASVSLRLANDQRIMRQVFRTEWDPEAGKFRPNPSILTWISHVVPVLFGRPYWIAPGPGRLALYLDKSIVVTDFGENDLKQLTYLTPNPEFGKYLLNRIYEAADDEMKENTLRRAERYIRYLERRLQTVTVTEHREALTQLLIDQERTRMTIDPDLPFAMQVVTPALASDAPTTPAIAPTIAIFLLAGASLGALLAFIFRRPALWDMLAGLIRDR
jgi:hypothetical protein